MNKNSVYNLEDRGILYIHGDDVLEYLQNIITNDVNKVSDTTAGLIIIVLVFLLIFKPNKKIFTINHKYNYVFALLFAFLIEWFLFHPSLRYGGFHLLALLFFIIVKESPMACGPVAQAVTGELLGPLRLYLIEIWPDNKFIKDDGIKKGEIFLIPFLSKIEEFL